MAGLGDGDKQRLMKEARCPMYQLFDLGILGLESKDLQRAWKDAVADIFREICGSAMTIETAKKRILTRVLQIGIFAFDQGRYLFFERQARTILKVDK